MLPLAELVATFALLSATADIGSGAPIPPEMARTLADTQNAVEATAACISQRAGTQSRQLDAQQQRLSELRTRIHSLWGRQAIVDPDIDERRVCKSRAALIALSEERLDTLARSFAAHLAPYNRGVWIGTMPLCGAGPVTTQAVIDEYSGDQVLQITLDKTDAARLADFTTANVGNQMAVRVDGKLVMEPYINEPIVGGSIQVMAPRGDLDELATLLKGCAR